MRTAVLTGASSGLGASLANLLLDKDYHVITVSRRPPLNKRVEWIQADLGTASEVEMCVAKILKENKSISLLVNNAAVSPASRIINMSYADFYKVIEIDFLAPRKLINGLAAVLTGGTIVNIISRVGLEGRIGLSAYGAAKELLLDYTLVNSESYARQGIRMFAVNPGFMYTEMVPDKILDVQKAESVMNVCMTPELSASLIFQLIMSSFSGGNVYDLDSRIYRQWNR